MELCYLTLKDKINEEVSHGRVKQEREGNIHVVFVGRSRSVASPLDGRIRRDKEEDPPLPAVILSMVLRAIWTHSPSPKTIPAASPPIPPSSVDEFPPSPAMIVETTLFRIVERKIVSTVMPSAVPPFPPTRALPFPPLPPKTDDIYQDVIIGE